VLSAVALGFVDRRLTAVLALVMRRERVQAVQVIADPRLVRCVGITEAHRVMEVGLAAGKMVVTVS
jgi:hypothetical protein